MQRLNMEEKMFDGRRHIVKASYWILISFIFSLLYFSMTIHAEVIDRTAPVLNGISMEKTSASVGETIYVDLDITEDGVGCTKAMVDFISVKNNETFTIRGDIGWYNENYKRYYTGIIRIPITIDIETLPGEYSIAGVSLSDELDNSISYMKSELEPLKLFVSNDSYTGITGVPRLTSLKINSDIVKAGEDVDIEYTVEGGTDFTIRVVLYSNQVALYSNGYYQDLYGGYFMDTWHPLDASHGKGTLSTSPFNYQTTEYSIREITIKAIDGKERVYKVKSSDAGEENRLYEPDGTSYCVLEGYNKLMIIGNEKEEKKDKIAPTIKSVSVDKHSVTIPGTVKVKFSVEDDQFLSEVMATIHSYNETYGNYDIAASNSLQISGPDNARIYSTYTGELTIPISRSCRTGTFNLEFVVQDTDYNGTSVSLGTITILPEDDMAFDVGIDHTNILGKIKDMKDGETGYIKYNDYSMYGNYTNTVAPKALFQAIQGRNVFLKFYCDAFEWIFNGKDITNPKDIILNTRLEYPGYFEDVNNPLHGTLNIVFPNNGTLPGQAQFRMKSDSIYDLYSLTHNIYLYYKNDGDDSLEYVDYAQPQYVLDDTDHWCYFNVKHNSTFVASSRKLDEKKPTRVIIYKITKKKGSTFNGENVKAQFKVTKTNQEVMLTKMRSNRATIVLPDKVVFGGRKYKITSIGDQAFVKCKKLKSITIGKKIKKIGKKAFYHCKNLKKINVKTTVLTSKKVGANAWKGIHKKCVIKVPKSKKKSYKKLFIKKGAPKTIKVK